MMQLVEEENTYIKTGQILKHLKDRITYYKR